MSPPSSPRASSTHHWVKQQEWQVATTADECAANVQKGYALTDGELMLLRLTLKIGLPLGLFSSPVRKPSAAAVRAVSPCRSTTPPRPSTSPRKPKPTAQDNGRPWTIKRDGSLSPLRRPRPSSEPKLTLRMATARPSEDVPESPRRSPMSSPRRLRRSPSQAAAELKQQKKQPRSPSSFASPRRSFSPTRSLSPEAPPLQALPSSRSRDSQQQLLACHGHVEDALARASHALDSLGVAIDEARASSARAIQRLARNAHCASTPGGPPPFVHELRLLAQQGKRIEAELGARHAELEAARGALQRSLRQLDRAMQRDAAVDTAHALQQAAHRQASARGLCVASLKAVSAARSDLVARRSALQQAVRSGGGGSGGGGGGGGSLTSPRRSCAGHRGTPRGKIFGSGRDDLWSSAAR